MVYVPLYVRFIIVCFVLDSFVDIVVVALLLCWANKHRFDDHHHHHRDHQQHYRQQKRHHLAIFNSNGVQNTANDALNLKILQQQHTQTHN